MPRLISTASRAATLALCLVGLAACGTAVYSEVTRFNNFSTPSPSGSFFIFPNVTQQGSAEFEQYKRSISGRFIKLGFREAPDLESADYAVLFAYGTNAGRQISGAMPMWGQTGGGSTYSSGNVSAYGTGGSAYGTYSGSSYTAPTYGVTGYMPYSTVEYDRKFIITIIDNKKSTPKNLVSAYEANVTSTGSAANFGTVSECIFDAVFENFYSSGTTSGSMAMDNCGK